MKVLGIHHVFLPSRSIGATVEFYTSVLGLTADPSGQLVELFERT